MLSAAAAGGGRNDVVWRDDTAGAIRCSRHVDECIAEVVDAKLQSHRIATTATCCAGGDCCDSARAAAASTARVTN